MGGMETLIVEIAGLAKEEGLHVPVIGSLKESISLLVRRAQDKALEVVYFDHKRSFITVRRIARFIKEENIDLVHTHNAVAHVKGAAAARKCKVPLVHTKHGNVLPFRSWRSRWLNKRAAKYSSRIIAVSDCVRDTIIKGYGISPEKVIRVHNGISLKQFFPRQDYGLDEAVIRVGAVGRLSKEKDIPTVLKAFKFILDKFPRAELSIIGDGAERESLEKTAEDLGVADSVRFLGARDRVWKILPKLDIFMQTSIMEGMSLTVLEAMAAGLPVVVTKVGGNPEVILEGKNGFLVPAGAPEKAAEAVIRLLEDKALRETIGRAARRRVEQDFSLQSMVDKYEEVYKSVVTVNRGQLPILPIK